MTPHGPMLVAHHAAVPELSLQLPLEERLVLVLEGLEFVPKNFMPFGLSKPQPGHCMPHPFG